MQFQQEERSGRGAENPDFIEMLSRHRAPAPPRGPAEERSERPDKEPFVLIVDDEVDALEALSAWLEDEGFATLQARNGREALDLLRSGRRPALILLDLKMPVMDGNEFLRQMAKEDEIAEIPVTVVTASATLREVPFRKNDAGFFLKPVDYERLLMTVRHYCG